MNCCNRRSDKVARQIDEMTCFTDYPTVAFLGCVLPVVCFDGAGIYSEQ